MRLLNFVRRHPISVLSLGVAAFAVWLWAHQSELPPPGDEQGPPPTLSQVPPRVVSKKPFPGAAPLTRPNPSDTAQVLPKLKPGMTRAEVEELVGVPAAQDILPATVVDGKVRYCTTYEADLEPPPTVRPIRTAHGRPPRPSARTVVALEFDATKPGHPLISIHYSDPLF
jgi:hypothetical protein